jgi:hypothetical protein
MQWHPSTGAMKSPLMTHHHFWIPVACNTKLIRWEIQFDISSCRGMWSCTFWDEALLDRVLMSFEGMGQYSKSNAIREKEQDTHSGDLLKDAGTEAQPPQLVLLLHHEHSLL